MPTPPPTSPPTPLPGSLDLVGADQVLAALQVLGHPTVFYHPSRDRPAEQDLPQLLGALSAAVERLAVHRLVFASDAARSWAAGYLQTCGASPVCGGQAFDMITMRLRGTAQLLEGYGTGGMGAVVALATTAAAGFATVSAIASSLRDSDSDGDSDDDGGDGRALRESMAARLREAQTALQGTRLLLADVLGDVLRAAGVDLPETGR